MKSFAARIWDKEVSSLLLKEVQDLLAIENLRRNFKEEFLKKSTLIRGGILRRNSLNKEEFLK